LITALLPKVMVLLLLPKLIAALLLFSVPFNVMADGAVATKPPAKLNVPSDAPRVKVPVWLKVAALVTLPLLAFKARLNALLALLKLGVVKAALKAMVPVVAVNTTLVTVSTVPAKVAPPELVTVTLPMLVPMLRKILTAPVVLNTMLDGQ
jgi:hypothetical protein